MFSSLWPYEPQTSLSITISLSFLKLMSIESVLPYNHLNLSHPLLLPTSIFPSTMVFSNESDLRIRCPEYGNFSFSISSSSQYSGLISFRMDWLDLLAVQGTRKSLLQHHSSKFSNDYLWHLYCLLDTFLVSNDEFFSFGESTKIGEETELRSIGWPYQNTTDEVA